jgi:leucyl-tRNA synthetase
VTEDFASFKYNTLIASLMTLRNQMKSSRAELEGSPAWAEAVDTLTLMLAPLTPFLAEELWQQRHPGASVHVQTWPKFIADLVVLDEVTVVIQVNGKMRERMQVALNTPTAELERLALAQPKVKEVLSGQTVRKVIAVENKLVNIVAGS